MAAGDAQRVWFPEMLDELTRAWRAGMDWEALAELCKRMTEMRRSIRRARGIKGPKTRCKCCGEVGDGGGARISIRSAIFALKKVGVLDDIGLRSLDRRWQRHRKARGLDAYGDVSGQDTVHRKVRRKAGGGRGRREEVGRKKELEAALARFEEIVGRRPSS